MNEKSLITILESSSIYVFTDMKSEGFMMDTLFVIFFVMVWITILKIIIEWPWLVLVAMPLVILFVLYKERCR